MAAWTHDELAKIGAAEELELAAEGHDGALRKPVTIWVVRVGDDLYVRSIHGHDSAWFRGAELRHEGRISAGGVEKDVTFVDVDADNELTEAIDAAFRAKYRRYAASIVNTTLTPEARAATLKLTPRATGS